MSSGDTLRGDLKRAFPMQDQLLRLGAIAAARALIARWGDAVPYAEIEKGFIIEGQRVLLMSKAEVTRSKTIPSTARSSRKSCTFLDSSASTSLARPISSCLERETASISRGELDGQHHAHLALMRRGPITIRAACNRRCARGMNASCATTMSGRDGRSSPHRNSADRVERSVRPLPPNRWRQRGEQHTQLRR